MDKYIEIIGANLQRRRQILGWSQNDAADKLEMKRMTYARLEKGIGTMGDSLFQRILDVFAVTSDKLLTPVPVCEYRFFRKNARETAREAALIEEATCDLVKRLKDYAFLEEIVGESQKCQSELLSFEKNARETVDAFADRIRQFLVKHGWNDNEILPEVLERLGLKLFMMPVQVPKCFGFSFAMDGQLGVFVNCESGISGERRLFTLAHEVGHLLLHRKRSDFNAMDEKTSKLLEMEANRFAARLLMPDDLFRAAWAEFATETWVDRVMAIKRRFRVSYKTVLFRLTEGRDPSYAGKIYAGFAHQYEMKSGQHVIGNVEPRPFPFSALSARRMPQLALKAMLKEEITMSRFAELIGKSLVEAREIVNDAFRKAVA